MAEPVPLSEGQVLEASLELVERVSDPAEAWQYPSTVGKAILARVADRLHAQLDAYLFGASVRLQTEQQAMAYVRGMALELKRGSDTLLKAAETLKAAGKVNAANQTYVAHKALQAKANEVLGG